jgi:predicted nucleic acid-binding protein
MLLDTGVFVALIDKSERNHEQCVAFLKEFKGKLFTTEPVLTETSICSGHRQKLSGTALTSY